MPLDAGRLNRKVAIQQRDDGTDAWGQPVRTWNTHANCWAWIKPTTGAAAAEQISGDAQTSAVHYSVRIRYREGLTAGMRILAGALTLDVAAVIPDVAGREHVDLVCVEGARDGG